MSAPHRRRSMTLVALSSAAILALPTAIAGASPATIATGPSTVTAPYLLPVADDVHLTSLLTVDDAGAAGNGYEMVGIPDGLGAIKQGANIVTYMNHELRPDAGVVRAHGQKGAFVSRLVLDPTTGKVKSGSDWIQPGTRYWDYLTSSFAAAPNAAGTRADGRVFPAYSAAFGRFCSGYLTEPGELFNEDSKRGFKGQLYYANEETGDEGRVFAVTKEGRAWQLPRLGLFSWENTVGAPNQSDTTLVMGNEDAATGQVWAYVGTKQKQGEAIEKAGLTNGENYVIDLLDETVSTDAGFRAKYAKGTAVPFDLSEVDWDQSGSNQNAEASAEGLTLNRIEDGAFDPQHPKDYWFVTTAGGTGPGSGGGGGLWKMTFNDLENPDSGGTLTLMLNGSEGLFSPDNLAIDTHGNLLIQEDPGGNPHLARLMAYRIADGALAPVAQFDAALFSGAGAITQDEESSGIIDAEALYGQAGTFLLDAQIHAAPANNAAEYVERGQFLKLEIDDWSSVYGS